MNLTEVYEKETGQAALYRMKSSDYHTLRYVRWLEAKLRELVEAAEWRDDLAGFYASTRNRPHVSKNGWWDNFYMENCRKADAEAAYQAALKAAKEE